MRQTLISIESHAINCVNMLMFSHCQAVTPHIEQYMEHILAIFHTVDPSDSMLRCRIIEGVFTVLEFHTEIVMKHLTKVLQLMLVAVNERDQLVGRVAAEFWTGLVQQMQSGVMDSEEKIEFVHQTIGAALPQLLPILLLCCRITQADMMNVIDTKDEDATLQPEEEDDCEAEGEEDYSIMGVKHNSTLR